MGNFLLTPARQAATLRETAHRPWPVAERPWSQAQTWQTLLFAHWRVEAGDLRPHVPDSLPLDLYDGTAWLGITPFRVSGLRLRGIPPLPVLSSFLELNVRTYANLDGKPGIWFFSLDAGSRLAVAGARRSYRLPYHHASMRAWRTGGAVAYRSARRRSARAYILDATYWPTSEEVRPPAPGSLEHFLTERYCLYSEAPDRTLLRAEIHHPPWPLRAADVELRENTMPPDGVDVQGEPLCHLATRQDVLIWSPQAV